MKNLKFRKLARKKNGDMKWFYYKAWENVKIPSNYPFIVASDLLYIGLKDCNEKDVYEGDILLIIPSAGEDKAPYYGVVEWVAPGFQIKAPKGKFPIFNDYVPIVSSRGLLDGFEVAGNIYENKDLIK